MRTSPLDNLVEALVNGVAHLGTAERGAVLWLNLYALKRRRSMLSMREDALPRALLPPGQLRVAFAKLPPEIGYITEDGAWICFPGVADIIARRAALREKKSRAAQRRWSHLVPQERSTQEGPRPGDASTDLEVQQVPSIGPAQTLNTKSTDNGAGDSPSGSLASASARSRDLEQVSERSLHESQADPYETTLALATAIAERPDAGSSPKELRRHVTRLWVQVYRDRHPAALLGALEQVLAEANLQDAAAQRIEFAAARLARVLTSPDGAPKPSWNDAPDTSAASATKHLKSHHTVLEMTPERERENAG